MRIEVLGLPFNGLGVPPNVENPAEALREAGLISALVSGGCLVTDLGDLTGFHFRGVPDPETGILDLEEWIAMSRTLVDRLKPILDRQAFPLLLGGDCSLLLGTFAALAQRGEPIGLAFFDGHADFNTAETSLSCEPANMELAVLTGRGPDRIACVTGQDALLADQDVVVYGIREWDEIAGSGIWVFDAECIASRGVNACIREGIAQLALRGVPVWAHLDVDVLDPAFMPAVFPEPGGLSPEEVEALLRGTLAAGRVVGMSVTCYHPKLDPDRQAGTRLVALLAAVLSNTADPSHPPSDG